MSARLDSEALRELAAGYVLGDLSSEEAEQFHQLMQQIPALEVEVAALQAALHMMPYGLAKQRPQPELRSRTMTAIQAAMMQTPAQQTPEQQMPAQSIASVAPTPAKQAFVSAMQLLSRSWQRRVIGGVIAGLMVALGVGVSQRRAQQFAQPDVVPSEAVPSIEAAQVEQAWAGFAQLLEDHRSALAAPSGPADFAVRQAEDVLLQIKGIQTTEAALPMLPQSQAKLLGASDCQFGKTSGLRLSFQVNDYPDKAQIVSAYQLDLEGDQFPQFVLPSTIMLRQRDGTSVVLWREASYLYALVAELPSADLDRLAHSVGQI